MSPKLGAKITAFQFGSPASERRRQFVRSFGCCAQAGRRQRTLCATGKSGAHLSSTASERKSERKSERLTKSSAFGERRVLSLARLQLCAALRANGASLRSQSAESSTPLCRRPHIRRRSSHIRSPNLLPSRTSRASRPSSRASQQKSRSRNASERANNREQASLCQKLARTERKRANERANIGNIARIAGVAAAAAALCVCKRSPGVATAVAEWAPQSSLARRPLGALASKRPRPPPRLAGAALASASWRPRPARAGSSPAW